LLIFFPITNVLILYYLNQGIGRVALLSRGHSFGELALTAGDDHRSATVQAKSRVEILQLHKVDYDHFVKDIQMAERRENFLILKNCSLFSNWTKSKIQKMCNTCVRKTFKAGEYVFQQGDPCDAIYFVIDGKIDVYKEVVVVVRNRWPSASGKGQEGLSKKKKKPFLVQSLKKEDYFGEQAIAQDQVRTISCVASAPSTVLSLDRLEFVHYIEDDVAIQVMKNAYDDYVQDKQILHSMIVSCKIRGGPSTTAQLNECLEVVDDYRPSTAPGVSGGAEGGGGGGAGGGAGGGGGRGTGGRGTIPPISNRTQSKTGTKSRPSTVEGKSSSSRSGKGSRKFITRASTMPYESFFSGSKYPVNTKRKDGVFAGSSQEKEEENDPLALPEASTQQKRMDLMKFEHLKNMRSQNASKHFSQQLSKMSNCADEMRIHRHKTGEISDAKAELNGIDNDESMGTEQNYIINKTADELSLVKSSSDKGESGLKKLAGGIIDIQR
jgi:CRP-like cAMP-binding protein